MKSDYLIKQLNKLSPERRAKIEKLAKVIVKKNRAKRRRLTKG